MGRNVAPLSIITPTIGRESLHTMLDCLVPQLSVSEDEVLIVGDGPQPRAREIVKGYQGSCIQYWEEGPYWNYGNPQRNNAIARARNPHLVFIDDDDLPEPDAIRTIRTAIFYNRKGPIIFKMKHPDHILWQDKEIRLANVSGQMFVPPNNRKKLGRWSGCYSADLDFIMGTMAFYPEGPTWVDKVILVQGLAGIGTIGHEIV